MNEPTVKKKSVNQVVYNGKTYTCNGERVIVDSQVRWMYRTKKGMDYDILICDDRYSENPEFTHITKLPSGCYTIPTSRTTSKYLTFTTGAGGASIGFCCWSEDYDVVDMGKNMQYSTDGGETWNDYTIGVGEDNLVAIEIDEGETVMFRGNNENLAYYLVDEDDYIYTKCIIEGRASAHGDITSLLNGVGGDVPVPECCYKYMFNNCTALVTAPELPSTTLAYDCYSCMFSGCSELITPPNLPATTLAGGCYSGMFKGCTSLTTAPELPATTLAGSCYGVMFEGCTSLTTAPELPATTLAGNCYGGMFQYCTSLTTAPELPATTLAGSCYSSMFSGCTELMDAPELPATTLADDCYSCMFEGCTSLTTAPELPATTLADDCYSYMFQSCTELFDAPELPATTLVEHCYEGMFSGCSGLTTSPVLLATTLAESCYKDMFYRCTSLTSAPILQATTLAEGCYSSMFYDCTGIISHNVATLNNSDNVFNNNTSCTSLTVYADTPPEIGEYTLEGLPADCIIYVAAASVDDYKAAQYWSARADYIQAIA